MAGRCTPPRAASRPGGARAFGAGALQSIRVGAAGPGAAQDVVVVGTGIVIGLAITNPRAIAWFFEAVAERRLAQQKAAAALFDGKGAAVDPVRYVRCCRTPGAPNPCALVIAGDRACVVVDNGSGTEDGGAAEIPPARIAGVLLTHFHLITSAISASSACRHGSVDAARRCPYEVAPASTRWSTELTAPMR